MKDNMVIMMLMMMVMIPYLAAGDSSSNPRTHNDTRASKGTGEEDAARFGAASANERHSLNASTRTSGHLRSKINHKCFAK